MDWRRSLGYAIGDLGINLYFISSMTFLLYFYTDILQISAAAAAGVMLVARLVDAVTDPIMGAIAERTRTRWGRLRPYLLLGALPLGLITVLTFTVPDLDNQGRVIWAYATYIGFGILYTVVTIPYSALTASLTDDYHQRTQLSTWRMGCAFLGAAAVTVGVPTLVPLFATEAQGYQAVMALFAIVATVLLAVTFFSTQEVVQPPAQQRLSWRDSADAVLANKPLMIVIGLFTLGMLSFTVRQTVAIYYFTYNLGRPDLIGLFFGLGLVVMFAGLPFVPQLANRFGKAGAIQVGSVFTVVACLGFYLTPSEQVGWIVFWGCLVALGGAPVAVLGWAMIPDTVEYAQWKHGKRADGAIYASSSFFQKLGKAIGGAGVAAALSAVGYVANQEQTPQTLEAIKQMLTFVPMGLMSLALVLARFYTLDSDMHARIRQDLSAETYSTTSSQP
jgi:GPH family glycoside/pentoside/hexuronide:cation symporter